MKLLRHIILVCLLATFSANAGEQLTANAKCAANQPTNAELQLLQGTWEGFSLNQETPDGPPVKGTNTITVTVTGNSLHFQRDTNFWFETAITLLAGTEPQQLHATIKRGASSTGEVVVVIFKIEDGTLTLATDNGSEEALKVFEGAPNRYELRKVHKKMSGSGLGSLVLEGHELHDSRDGQTYKTISFKNALTDTTVTWMAQNLNYKVQGSYAYDDKESNRKELGLLYTWEAAKKACPKDWHLATDSEWSMLATKFGGTDKAGEALKSVSGWKEDGNGTNSSGFNALPAGIRRNNGYDVLGALGFWWTSTPTGEEGKAWGWNMSFAKPLKTKVFRFDGPVSHAKSLRCVRD
jgi:uncharacterized protein (TIGR02145 family)/uncharacterized protein (TIGR03067 family)